MKLTSIGPEGARNLLREKQRRNRLAAKELRVQFPQFATIRVDLVFNDADLDVMMQVKNVFNPHGLLNPSKVFPTRRSCTEIGKNTTTNTAEIGKRVEAVLLRGNGDR